MERALEKESRFDQIRSEIQGHYVDEQGLVSPFRIESPKFQASGNGLAYSALYYLLLWKNGQITQEDRLNFSTLIMACSPKELGLIQRSPSDDTQQTHDDLLYMAIACWALGLRAPASLVINHLCENFGIYNTENPGSIRAKDGRIDFGVFLPRHLDMMCALKWAEGEKAAYPLRAFLAYRISQTMKGRPFGDTNGIIKVYALSHMALGCGGRLERWAVNKFNAEVARAYPGGMKQAFEIYFNDPTSEIEHPFIRML